MFADRKTQGLLALALVLTGFLYRPALKAEFVYDDVWYIVRNPSIRLINLDRYFRDPLSAAAPESGLSVDVYRPLGTLALAVVYKASGLRPAVFHFMNLILHLLNGILLWMLVRRLSVGDEAAMIGAVVFLWHPAQVQSVAWACQLTGLLGGLGFLAAANAFFVEGKSQKAMHAFGGLVYIAAVFTKESTLVLPLILTLFWQKRSTGQNRFLLKLYLIALAYAFVRYGVLRHLSQLPDDPSVWAVSLAQGLLAFAFYLGKIVAPLWLRASYGYPWFSLSVLSAALFSAGLFLALFVIGMRRRSLAGTGLGWIFVGLLPFLQIIPIRAFAAERFLYIPLMGVGVLVSWMWKKFPSVRMALVLWSVWLGFLAMRQVPVWRNEQTLWSEAVKQEPTNAFAHACLAETLGNSPHAEQEFKLALVNVPSAGVRGAALQNLASIYHARGDDWRANYWRLKSNSAAKGL